MLSIFKRRAGKRLLAGVLSAAVLCSAGLIGIPPVRAEGSWTDEWTYAAPWTYDAQQDALSYSGSDLGAPYRVSHNSPVTTNCVDFSVRLDGAPAAGNAHVGLWYTCLNGDVYYFTYNAGGGYAAIVQYPAGGGETYLNTGSANPVITQGEWTDFKVVLEDDYLAFYIGGALMHRVAGEFNGVFDGGVPALNDYAYPASFRVNSLETQTLGWLSEWTADAGWKLAAGETALSYNGADLGAAYRVSHDGAVTTNCVDVSLRIDGAAAADNAHTGVWITAASGDTYYFMYSPVYHYPAVIKNFGAAGETYLSTEEVSLALNAGEWADFKVILEDSFLAFYIDGVLMHRISGDFDGVFDGSVPAVNDYATPLSVKVNSIEPQELDWMDTWSGDAAWSPLTGEDGFSCAGTDLGAAHSLIHAGPVDTNCIDFSMRIDGAANADNAHTGLRFTCVSGDVYYFQYSPVYHYASVVKYPAEGGEIYLNVNSVNVTLTEGEWVDCRVILEEDYVAFYIDGDLMHLISGEFTDVFRNGVPAVNSYATPLSVKINSLKPIDTSDLGGDATFPDAWQYNDNWELQPEGYLQYQGGDELIARISYNYPLNTNTIEFSARVDQPVTQTDANLGLMYTCPNGKAYFFQYATYSGYGGEYGLISEYPEGPNGRFGWVTGQIPKVLEPGEWHTFKVVLKSDVIALYADGELLCYYYDDFGDDFRNGTCSIQSYGTMLSVRVDGMEPQGNTIFDYDFEFDRPASVDYFSAENGTVSHRDSSLIFDVAGSGAYVETPTIMNARGHKYSALASVRNTVFARLNNDTDATQLKVTVTTDSGNASLLVPVEPHSGYQSHFINFSQHNLTGYVRRVRFEPVGVSSGTLEIDSITFEKEKPLIDFPGEILSCLADEQSGTVTVTGSLKPEYSGQTVTIYETSVRNVANQLTGDVIASAQADGVNFRIQFPLQNGKMTRLSSMFIAGVGDKRLGDRFVIENGASFEDNPYAFTLPDRRVLVTDSPYNAKGDAFTDDSAAIQAAIDAVSALGGGTVVVPGDPDNFYGRRYVITNVQLKSNVELHIEEGAVLWQSPRLKDYAYDPAYGHKINLNPPITWSAAAFITNYPMVNAYEAENVKVTGKGEIRGADHGGESFDGTTGEARDIGCDSLIHVFNLGFYDCKNVEVSGLWLTRPGGYFSPAMQCENVFYSDVKFFMPACVEADMIDLLNSKNVFINRCFGHSNDDAVVLNTTVNDPRAQASPWWDMDPTADNCVENVTVAHSNFVGGKGLTFITWGSNRDDISQQEIKNITAYDCRFNFLYTWYDNPYYGTPNFTSLEEDFSPIKQIRIFNCWFDKTPRLKPNTPTDVVTDMGLRSTNQFVYGDFERRDPNHPEWITGLANWTVIDNGGAAASIPLGDGHVGKITGKAALAQGLYMKNRDKIFHADIRVESGRARMFVQDILTGEILVEQAVDSSDFETWSLSFRGTDRNLYLGVEGLTDDAVVYLDNARVEHVGGDDEGHENYPRAEDFLIDQTKTMVTATDDEIGAVLTRNEVSGSPRIELQKVFLNEWEFSYTVTSASEDNRLRTFLQNSDAGKQILLDFWYHDDKQLMVSFQYKTGKNSWSEPVTQWVDLPEGSREYTVKITHKANADTATLEIFDKAGEQAFTTVLEHPNYTCSLFYGTGDIYGLYFVAFDWSPGATMSDFYCGPIGGDTLERPTAGPSTSPTGDSPTGTSPTGAGSPTSSSNAGTAGTGANAGGPSTGEAPKAWIPAALLVLSSGVLLLGRKRTAGK